MRPVAYCAISACLLFAGADNAEADVLYGSAGIGSGKIFSIDPATLSAALFDSTAFPPVGLAFGDNSLYIELPGGNIARIDTGGTLINLTTVFSPSLSLGPLAFGNGTLYGTAGTSSGEIYALDSVTLAATPLEGTASLPIGLAFGDNSLYAEFSDGEIARIGTDGTPIKIATVFSPTLSVAPLAFGDGKLYGAAGGGGSPFTIYSIDPLTLAATGLVETAFLPTALAFGNDSLYAGFSNGDIARFDTAGATLDVATVFSPSVIPGPLAFASSQQVPEPSSLGLFALPLAVLVAMRRRRTVTSGLG